MKSFFQCSLAIGLVVMMPFCVSAQFYQGQWLQDEDGEMTYVVFTSDSVTFVTQDEDEGCFEFVSFAYSANGDVLTIQDPEEAYDLSAFMEGNVLFLSGVGDAEGFDYELQSNGDDLEALVDCNEDPSGIGFMVGSELSVYPIPARESVTIVPPSLPAHCRLYNAKGECLWGRTLQTSSFVLERVAWTSGVYVLEVRSDTDVEVRQIVFE